MPVNQFFITPACIVRFKRNFALEHDFSREDNATCLASIIISVVGHIWCKFQLDNKFLKDFGERLLPQLYMSTLHNYTSCFRITKDTVC